MVEYLKEGRGTTSAADPAVRERVSAMLADIERDGEDAVRALSDELDHHDPPSFRLDDAQLDELVARVPDEVRAAVDAAAENVGAFARAQRASLQDVDIELAPGHRLGHTLVPVESVGCYVPGGRYPLISSALMSVLTAKIAGVNRVVAMTAPTAEGSINPATAYAMRRGGADAIYALGGVQGLGALAYGALDGLDPVDMIVGAGNAFVAEAKRQLFGRVGIDLLAGPTEVLVLADETAEAETVAVDLLAQAEHGPTSPAVLVTTSEALARDVIARIPGIAASWATGETAMRSWEDFGVVAVASSREEAVALADEIASEHLQIQTADADWYVDRLHNYGTAFVGEETTVAYGDKAAGTNHTLPTGRAARYTGGLWVGTFLKPLTWQRLDRAASVRVGRITSIISEAEGLVGHARSADLRVERFADSAD